MRAFWSHGGCQVISNALLPSCETEASALGEYIPAAEKSTADEIGNLPGFGGAFNTKRNNIGSNVEFMHTVVAETRSQREPTAECGSTASRWLSAFGYGTPLPLVSAIPL